MPTPASAYRIQFDPAVVDLEDATHLIDHLHGLGATHVYASPLTTSRPGSPHGYDVVDPSRIDPELGGVEALERLSTALRESGMGLILDIVPNHMAIGRHNPWWMDVLARGRDSAYWEFFDFRASDTPILLPVLGRPYAETLEEGELKLVVEGDDLFVAYWEDRYPLSPSSTSSLLDKAGVKQVDDTPALLEVVRSISRDPDALHELLDRQHYRLAWWQLSRERLDHRRFFTITELVGVRQELGSVFEATHRLVLDLIERGIADGLRIDHVDGLRDPAGYLDRLDREAPGAYVVVEKILAADEHLPERWQTAGTTGYEYIDASAKAFVHPEGYAVLRSHYGGFAASPTDFDRLVFDQQRFIIHERLGAETIRFTAELARLARQDRDARDALSSDLIELAIDVIASLPVYRTYAVGGQMSDEDRRRIDEALDLARVRGDERPSRVERFIEKLLKLEHAAAHDPEERSGREDFVERLQQFTGAVMAKGVEDTAFYQYNVLLSLNEVGGHPATLPPDPVGAYHQHNLDVAASFPHTMTTATTHDTKRSEDVRNRISAISQFADEWVAKVGAWHVRNRIHRLPGSAGLAPTNNEELFIYQTLLGSWPLEQDDSYADRIVEHLIKAAREAKVHTEWLDPDQQHEDALSSFARNLLDNEEFVAEIEEFGDRIWRVGALDSLAQTVLRLMAPGVPDIYQGAELWDLSLTDPDNRRPVDWDLRRAMTTRALETSMVELAETWRDGAIKLRVLGTALQVRRAWADVLLDGEYVPLVVEGDRAENAIAFGRHHDDRWIVAIVPRLTVGMHDSSLWPTAGWESTTVLLPDAAPTAWHEEFSDHSIDTSGCFDLAGIFSDTPVAVLRSAHQAEER